MNGDSIASATLTSPATAASNVGNYNLTATGVTFGSGLASNYNITLATRTNGLGVTQRPLIVTPDAQSRIFGDANPTTGTATGNNLVNGDTVASVTVTSPATVASNVGSYYLTATGVTFGAGLASNYSITLATRAGGLSVIPRDLALLGLPSASGILDSQSQNAVALPPNGTPPIVTIGSDSDPNGPVLTISNPLFDGAVVCVGSRYCTTVPAN